MQIEERSLSDSKPIMAWRIEEKNYDAVAIDF